MDTYKEHYYDVVMDMDGFTECIKAEAEREDAALQMIAPSAIDDKRRFFEMERAKIVQSSVHPLTRELALSGFIFDDRFFAQAERMTRLDGMDDDGLRAWHWGTAYRIGLINYSLSLLVEDVPVWNGIAADFAKWISGASDRTLSYIIKKHCLPAGMNRPIWKGSEQDGNRFRLFYKMTETEFNKCFAMKNGKRLLAKNFKTTSFRDGKDNPDGKKEAPIYQVLNKYRPE